MVPPYHPCYNRLVEATKKLAQEVHQRLLEIYGQPEIRERLPPVDQLISTILSQNTNDTNRDRAYESLRTAFPTWEAVRDGNPESVIEAIRSAGLANQKGPRIQRLLRQITAERGQIDLDFLRQLPPEKVNSWLIRFKGVGPKTAAIVMLFSLGMPAFPVDTHIYRVTGRLGLRPDRVNADEAHNILGELFSPESYYPIHLNIIRHGRQVCTARRPDCDRCPLNDLCVYYQNLMAEANTDSPNE